MTLHMIGVSSHASVAARINWYPWSNPPDFVVIGWRGEVYDTNEELYIYLSPSLDGMSPAVALFAGRYGDPSRDRMIGVVTEDGFDG